MGVPVRAPPVRLPRRWGLARRLMRGARESSTRGQTPGTRFAATARAHARARSSFLPRTDAIARPRGASGRSQR